ncbi:MAG: hypothetical protein APF81_19295 [Desulfosporosinus sp. BRH_c37]|nr:MAG: hypothetical protein APF81_19295 [Desulfosporosinus sp. BRH_c37]
MFNNQEHKDAFLSLCPGKLLTDVEWSSPIFIFTSDEELRRKTAKHIHPKKREINWDAILKNDFGSGHYSAIYWAFTLWAGNSWQWNDKGERIEPIDTMSRAYYMDENLQRTAITALELRWRLKGVNQQQSTRP